MLETRKMTRDPMIEYRFPKRRAAGIAKMF
jgi:hypothetical protein